jgi:glycosyltransferase involved in cell wall biosynthesis
VAERASALPEVTIVAHDIGPVGGMERQLSELISGLLEAGHRVTAVSRTCELPPHPGLRHVRVPGPARPFAIAFPCFALLGSLLTWARGRGVVHTTGAIVLNRAALCTVHLCHPAVGEVEGLSRVSRQSPAHRLNARLAAAISHLAERFCYRPGRTRRLVGVSAGVATELRRHFPRMRERVLVIPNGVDTEAFRPPAEGERNGRDGELDALFVGSEWSGKGLRIAIEALAGCPGARLTVVGRGDVDSYRRMAEAAGAADRVEFVGTSSDVASWYRRADVFVLPSAYETFSLVTYEAAASGLPLLATRVSGVEDLLRDGVNGWFVERDPGDLGGRIRALQGDPARRREMGAAARSASLEHSWARVVERYRELYAEAAAAGEARR